MDSPGPPSPIFLEDQDTKTTDEEEEEVTWFTFYSHEERREYYYEPISGRTTWNLPEESVLSHLPGSPPGGPPRHRSPAKSRFGFASILTMVAVSGFLVGCEYDPVISPRWKVLSGEWESYVPRRWMNRVPSGLNEVSHWISDSSRSLMDSSAISSTQERVLLRYDQLGAFVRMQHAQVMVELDHQFRVANKVAHQYGQQATQLWEYSVGGREIADSRSLYEKPRQLVQKSDQLLVSSWKTVKEQVSTMLSTRKSSTDHEDKVDGTKRAEIREKPADEGIPPMADVDETHTSDSHDNISEREQANVLESRKTTDQEIITDTTRMITLIERSGNEAAAVERVPQHTDASSLPIKSQPALENESSVDEDNESHTASTQMTTSQPETLDDPTGFNNRNEIDSQHDERSDYSRAEGNFGTPKYRQQDRTTPVIDLPSFGASTIVSIDESTAPSESDSTTIGSPIIDAGSESLVHRVIGTQTTESNDKTQDTDRPDEDVVYDRSQDSLRDAAVDESKVGSIPDSDVVDELNNHSAGPGERTTRNEQDEDGCNESDVEEDSSVNFVPNADTVDGRLANYIVDDGGDIMGGLHDGVTSTVFDETPMDESTSGTKNYTEGVSVSSDDLADYFMKEAPTEFIKPVEVAAASEFHAEDIGNEEVRSNLAEGFEAASERVATLEVAKSTLQESTDVDEIRSIDNTVGGVTSDDGSSENVVSLPLHNSGEILVKDSISSSHRQENTDAHSSEAIGSHRYDDDHRPANDQAKLDETRQVAGDLNKWPGQRNEKVDHNIESLPTTKQSEESPTDSAAIGSEDRSERLDSKPSTGTGGESYRNRDATNSSPVASDSRDASTLSMLEKIIRSAQAAGLSIDDTTQTTRSRTSRYLLPPFRAAACVPGNRLTHCSSPEGD